VSEKARRRAARHWAIEDARARGEEIDWWADALAEPIGQE
jgi:hypothetical protein